MKLLPPTHDDFRPSDGLFSLPAETLLLASVKGASRRALIEQASAEDRLEELHPNFFKVALTEDERAQWGRMHPRNMGGEFLPDRKRTELEIARIAIESTTRDVVSVYARRVKSGFVYRIVDEYSGDTLEGRTQFRRRRQLTQAELVTLLMTAWPLDEVCLGNDLVGEDALNFCEPFSAYYPDFAARIRAYLGERCAAADENEDEDEDEVDDLE